LKLSNPRGYAFPPNVFEPARRQCGVARGRIDRAMAKIGLQCSGIDALVGQRVAAGMPEHDFGFFSRGDALRLPR
jgi:hypothetical protein